jgi:adenine deaminase
MVRHGGVRRDVENVAPLWSEPLDWRRLILVTDSVDAVGLRDRGYLDRVVQRAIDTGLDPVRAIQAATLNVAEHFRLDHRLGAIAPGREADLALLPDARTIRPTLVLSRGRIVARDGAALVRARRHHYPAWLQDTVRLPGPATAEWFRLPAPPAGARVRALTFGEGLVTAESWLDAPEGDDALAARPADDVAKLVCIDRQAGDAARFMGLARGFGLHAGACATTTGWDAACITAIAADDDDLALAVNRVVALRGGVVVCAGGRVVAELPTPVAGIWCAGDVAAVAAADEELVAALRHLGVSHPRPLLALDILTTGAIPHLRITPRGYVRLRDGALLGLCDPGEAG